MNWSDSLQCIRAIGVVGTGRMGSMMCLAFADLGLDVSVWDMDTSRVDCAVGLASKLRPAAGRVAEYRDIHSFAQSLDISCGRRLFLFADTNGKLADAVLDQIRNDVRPGDVILDGSNQDYRNTERRQRELHPRGVSWIGLGVSGGHLFARRGPSICPSGDRAAVAWVTPLLQQYAAKDARTGKPCVKYLGPRGVGHYVKMVHDGIEGSLLGILCESWSFLHKGLNLSYDGIAEIYDQWNSNKELRNTYLLQTGADVLRQTKTADSDDFVLDFVLDTVGLHDDEETESTPSRYIMESARHRLSVPTLASAHFLRVASSTRTERIQVARRARQHGPQRLQDLLDRTSWTEILRQAVYCCFLASFVQGLELLARASRYEGWDIDMVQCVRIWRAGCTIQSEQIVDLIQDAMARDRCPTNLKCLDAIAAPLYQHLSALKEVVLRAVHLDHYVPVMSATLEYLKYSAGTSLPTQFMEAQMDHVGAHGYGELKRSVGDPGTGSRGHHHSERTLA